MKKFTHVRVGKFEIVKSSNMRPTGKLITGGFSSASVITTTEKEKSEFRTNYNSNRKTFREAELLMFSNYESKEKTSYITLMYEVPELDSKNFHRDIKVFVKSLKRAYPENPLKYICATELGHNLSYHAHLLIFWESKAPNDIAKYWKHGRAFRKDIQIDEHFSYIVRYLTGYNREANDDETEELFGELTREEIACINYYHGGVSREKKSVIN